MLTNYNNIINKYIDERKIIPISLKLIQTIKDKGICQQEGLKDNETNNETQIENVDEMTENVIFSLPDSVDKNKLTGSTYLTAIHKLKNGSNAGKFVEYRIHFRSQTGSSEKNLNINGDLKKVGSTKWVQMGKGITALKNKINAKSNEYYLTIDNNDELADVILNTFYKIENAPSKQTIIDLLNNFDKEQSNKFHIKNRPAIAGMLGLLNKLIDNKDITKETINKNELIPAFNLIYQLCTLNDSKYKSQWWLIM